MLNYTNKLTYRRIIINCSKVFFIFIYIESCKTSIKSFIKIWFKIIFTISNRRTF